MKIQEKIQVWLKKLLIILAVNVAILGGPVLVDLVITIIRRLEKPSDPS